MKLLYENHEIVLFYESNVLSKIQFQINITELDLLLKI